METSTSPGQRVNDTGSGIWLDKQHGSARLAFRNTQRPGGDGLQVQGPLRYLGVVFEEKKPCGKPASNRYFGWDAIFQPQDRLDAFTGEIGAWDAV